MHVLYFHQYFSTPDGACGLRSYQMARRLVKCGHRVTMVCASRRRSNSGLTGEPVHGLRRGTVDGIDVIEVCVSYSNYDSLVKRSITFLRLALKNVGIAARTDYDVLFATSTPLTAGIPGIVMKLLKARKPFVFEVRDLWPELPKAMGVVTNPPVLWGMSVLEWLSYRCANALIGLSPGIVEGIRRRCSPSKPVTMIPNGCDLGLIEPFDNTSDDVLAECCPNTPRQGLRAIFTGAHGQANGLDAVLDAARELKARRRDDIRLFFVGDGKTKPSLMRRASDEGLDNCVFVDYMPKHKLIALMRQMHVGLMILENVPAFYYGTSPNKFFDYIAIGMPVLNNYPGWLAELIEQHECGLAVPPEDANAFADALIYLADEPATRKRMGMRSRQLAEARFERGALADQFVACLEQAKNGGVPWT